jgi:hypothetical protein
MTNERLEAIVGGTTSFDELAAVPTNDEIAIMARELLALRRVAEAAKEARKLIERLVEGIPCADRVVEVHRMLIDSEFMLPMKEKAIDDPNNQES